MKDIHFEALSKNYGHVRALAEFSLHVPAGEIIAILGPSGSGKSTLLNICAGLTMPSSGRVWIDGTDITNLPAERRDIGVVFQSYALFPHLSVLENVTFPLRTRRHWTARPEARKQAEEMLARVGLQDYGNRRPTELSGGQQQRVALARALVFRPQLLLLDEPLGAVDPQLKLQLIEDILRLRDELSVTMLYVTHDQQEAMSIADQVAILHQGALQQVGTAQAIYDHPANEFVATFFGAGNLVRGRLDSQSYGGNAVVKTELGTFRIGDGLNTTDGKDVLLLIRPEAISLTVEVKPTRAINQVAGAVRGIRFLGAFMRVLLEISPGTLWIADCPRSTVGDLLSVGAKVDLSWGISDTHVVGASLSKLSPEPADLEGALDDATSALHSDRVSKRRHYA
jgi:ABC-type Fe3+/spermidine/putrescine transport system ATPase subunit